MSLIYKFMPINLYPTLKSSDGEKEKIRKNCLYLYFFLFTVGLLRLLYYFVKSPNNYEKWDFLFVSAIAVFVISFKFSLDIPKKMSETVEKLHKRKIIDLEDDKENLLNALNKREKKFAKIVSISVGMVLFLGWIISLKSDFNLFYLFCFIFETYLACLTGHVFGNMAAYGTLGNLIKKINLDLRLNPDDIDGASGLKPIGDFYFFQAMIASAPALFIAIWWLLLNFLSNSGYDIPNETLAWKNQAILLLPLAIFFELLVFILPILSIHEIMCEFKAKFDTKLDDISKDIAGKKNNLVNINNKEDYILEKSKIFHLKETYRIYEQMNTCPVTVKTSKLFKLFTINNLFLLLPIVLKNMENIPKLVEIIKNYFR